MKGYMQKFSFEGTSLYIVETKSIVDFCESSGGDPISGKITKSFYDDEYGVIKVSQAGCDFSKDRENWEKTELLLSQLRDIPFKNFSIVRGNGSHPVNSSVQFEVKKTLLSKRVEPEALPLPQGKYIVGVKKEIISLKDGVADYRYSVKFIGKVDLYSQFGVENIKNQTPTEEIMEKVLPWITEALKEQK